MIKLLLFIHAALFFVSFCVERKQTNREISFETQTLIIFLSIYFIDSYYLFPKIILTMQIYHCNHHQLVSRPPERSEEPQKYKSN